MTTRRVRFEGGSGHTLAGLLEVPAGEPEAFAVFVPCFTCLKDAKAIVRVSRTLAERGIATLRFDLTGLGQSGGDFARTTFSSQLDDLEAAAAFLRAEHRAPGLLIGISLGGAVVLAGAARVPEARAVATVNAPSDTVSLSELLLRLAPELETEEAAMVEIVGRRITIGRPLVEDLANHDVQRAVAELGMPLLVLHALRDAIVPVEAAGRIIDAARQPKSFVAIDGADHLLLSDPRDARFAGEVLATWAGRYVS